MLIAVASEMPRTDHGPKQRVARMDRRVIVVTALGRIFVWFGKRWLSGGLRVRHRDRS